MGKIALIDGDIIAHQIAYEKQPRQGTEAGFSTENASATDEDTRTWEDVRESIDLFMRNLLDEVGAVKYAAFLSPSRKSNFRSTVASSQKYKGNRDKRETPPFFAEIKTYLESDYKFHQLSRVETDDMLGIMQVEAIDREEERNYIICSIDKDLKQVPGLHYNWRKQEATHVDVDSAINLLWTQMLTGDPGDNILGCGEKETLVYKSGEKKGQEYQKRVGVGPKEAEKILANVKDNDHHKVVFNEYMTRFGHYHGIRKFAETYALVFIMKDKSQAEFYGEELPEDLNEFVVDAPWIVKPKEENDEW
jgi:hypothetical protein